MKLLVEFKENLPPAANKIIEEFLWALLEWKYLGQFDIKFTFEVDKEL